MAEANDNSPVGIERPATIHTDCHPNNPCLRINRPIRTATVHGRRVNDARAVTESTRD